MNSRHQASSSGVAGGGGRGLSSERKFSSVATPDMATTRRQSERIVRSGGVPGGGTVAAGKSNSNKFCKLKLTFESNIDNGMNNEK